MKHALEPDHLVAVATLVRGESRVWRLVKLGALWGAGHLSTVALGVAILTTLRVTVSAEHLVLFETPVAAMLIGLGGWTMLGAIATGGGPLAQYVSHVHGGAHAGAPAGAHVGTSAVAGAAAQAAAHGHAHAYDAGAHGAGDTHQPPFAGRPRPAWWSYAVGSVHGLAGSGALVMFVAATFPEPRMAVSYVVLFGTGAMLGMALITSTLVWPMRMMERRPMVLRAVTGVAGALSVMLGAGVVVEVVKTVWG